MAMNVQGKEQTLDFQAMENRLRRALALLAALIALWLCVTPTRAHSQSASKSVSSPVAATTTPPKTASAHTTNLLAGKTESERTPGGQHEGIQVHGHWVIEVKNPDGKVTTRREFENSIQPYGAAFLASLIAANNSSGGLSILLNGAGTTYANLNVLTGSFFLNFSEAGPCLPLSAGAASTGGPAGGTTCLITSANGNLKNAGTSSGAFLGLLCLAFQASASSTSQTAPCSTNLTETAPAFSATGMSGSSAQVQLQGSVTVTAVGAGLVTDVETVFTACDANTTPGACMNAGANNGVGTASPVALNLLTRRLLDGQNGDPQAVPYSPGQTINVSVTISFQ